MAVERVVVLLNTYLMFQNCYNEELTQIQKNTKNTKSPKNTSFLSHNPDGTIMQSVL